MPVPPSAPKKPHVHKIHNDQRQDDYYWLRDKNNPEVIDYLEAENQYHAEVMEPLQELGETLYQDMISRIPPVEPGVPVHDSPYYYYWRINDGQEYRTYYRKRAATRAELENSPEELLLDVNQLVRSSGYLDVSRVEHSPDHERLLYLENRDGSDCYTLYIKDLATGQVMGRPVENVFIDQSEWHPSGSMIYYLAVDEAQRPYRLYRHTVGNSASELLYEEPDIQAELELTLSQSGSYLFLTTATKTSSEVRYLDLTRDSGTLRLFRPRRPDILYWMEHWHDQFVILTNEGAENFQILAVPVQTPERRATPLLPYDSGRYWEQVLPFQDGLVIAGRENGLSQIWIYSGDSLSPMTWDEALFTVSLGQNRMYQTNEVLLNYESMVTPRTVYGVSISTGAKTLLQQQAIRDYDPSRYEQRQWWVSAQDGAQIPVSLVAKKETWDALPAPVLLNGYGSYGINSEPDFDVRILPLLDRGVIFAVAHVRGGAELGRHWYDNGKLLAKKNSFTDFVDVAQTLVNRGLTTPGELAAEGRSAGGLLMGAILNLRPDLFQVVSAGVPFVDVVTTMLDASIPLTALEWDEWGNPEDPDYYFYMKSYSPYDNVRAAEYPHIYVVTGLNDPRVGFFEPAKWTARLRALKQDNHDLVLKTHMGSGHFGSSGRLAPYRERAQEYAFVLDKLGIQF